MCRAIPRQPTPNQCANLRPIRSAASADAELVALWVAHRDGVAPDGLVGPGDAGSGLNEPLYLVADQSLSLLASHLAPGHPDVEVDAVLGGLALGHPLEVQPGAFPRRVNPRGQLAELLLRY